MISLFLDTAVKGCNIALFDNHRLIGYRQEPIERGHAETLLPLYEALSAAHSVTPQDINQVFVTVGPGSFTGLRVGLTAARFIGFSLGVTVQGISSFDAFACAVAGDDPTLVVIETKRSDYYCRAGQGEAQCLEAAAIEKILKDHPDMTVTGDAVKRLRSEITFDHDSLQQDMVDVPAVIRAIQSESLPSQSPDPAYVFDLQGYREAGSISRKTQ